jgi:hypothetical protein
MRMTLRGWTTLLTLAACFLQLGMPAQGQTTVLTGSVSRTDVLSSAPAFIGQRARMDVVPVSQPVRAGVSTTARPRTIVRTVYVRDRRTYWQRHPKIKAAAIGAGVGAGAGAVTGLISGRGVLRGAAIGAGTGAGVGLVRSSRTMRRHPIMRDTATGALVGLGIGGAASRSGRRALQGTAVGAAVGLGVGLLRDGLR